MFLLFSDLRKVRFVTIVLVCRSSLVAMPPRFEWRAHSRTQRGAVVVAPANIYRCPCAVNVKLIALLWRGACARGLGPGFPCAQKAGAEPAPHADLCPRRIQVPSFDPQPGYETPSAVLSSLSSSKGLLGALGLGSARRGRVLPKMGRFTVWYWCTPPPPSQCAKSRKQTICLATTVHLPAKSLSLRELRAKSREHGSYGSCDCRRSHCGTVRV